MSYKIHKEEVLLKTPILTVKLLNVVAPKNQELKRIVVEKGPAVVIVALTDKNEVVLVKQWRAGSKKKMLELPAGVVDAGEEPAIAAQRELREEIGFRADSLTELGSSYVSPGYVSERFYFYLAQDLKYDPLPCDEEEDLEVVYLPLAQASLEESVKEDVKTWLGLLAAEKFLKN